MPDKTYSITSDVTNGAANLSVKTAAMGDPVEVTFTANGENYKLEESSVCYEKKGDPSTAKPLTPNNGKYSFYMPDYDVVVKAVFAKTTHTVTCNVTNGTATVNPTGEIKEGTSVTVTFKPDEDKANYVLKENPKLDSGNLHTTLNVSDGVGTFNMDKNDVIITAEFVEPTTPSEGDNTSDNTNNGGEETQALEAEERTVHGAAEKTTITAMAVFTCTDKNCASAQFVDATVKQTSGVTTAAVTFNGKDYTAKYGEKNGWVEENGKKYWYEKGVKQGTTGRGKEIYDPDSDAWYWLDAVQGGAMTVNKDVYQESNGGKWVRYDANGHMIKGWDTNDKGTYYFDLITGAMAKGDIVVDNLPCSFDTNTGIGCNLMWHSVDGKDYWYEAGKRQGYDPNNAAYRGKEIYDPASGAWYWLDNVQQGAKTVSKDVYQESEAGDWAENADGTGKWVRYDANGHMVKGWDTNNDGTYYFDQVYGTMAKGIVTIDGNLYLFDVDTGVMQASITASEEAMADRVIELVNQERTSRGLQPLLKHDGLMVAAAARARELSQRYSHTRPDGSECFTILWHLGIDYAYAGENIAMGQKTPEIVMNDWMNSSGHRANILSENFDCIGVGCTMVDGYPYWVQLFTGDFDW